MGYNPKIHHRRSIRLKGYDYTRPGWYFITICTWRREYFFKKYPVLKGIVQRCWDEIPQRYHGVLVDEFVIMPNHLHGIIVIEEGGAKRVASVNVDHHRTLGQIVGEFKSLCVHNWLDEIKRNEIKALGKFWHRNYYERIVRDEGELGRVRLYIRNNPLKWEDDDLEYLGEKVL